VLEQLPHLFDRKFLLGHFLPVTLFLGVVLAVLAPLRGIHHIITGIENDPALGLIYAVVLSLILAYNLVAINRPLIVLLEGYYFPLGSISWLTWRQIKKRRNLEACINKIAALERSLDAHKREHPEKFTDSERKRAIELQNKRGRRLRRLVNNFPDGEEHVLPTRFGNVIRAFEVYPRVMYGIDSIPGWYRLSRVMDKTSEEQTSSDKALVDYYVNLVYLSFAILPFIIIRGLHDLYVFSGVDWLQFALSRWWQPAAFLGALVLAWVFYNGAVAAALGWGAQVKADFDVYIDDLARKLGYEPPLPKDLWGQISQAFVYNAPLPPKKVLSIPAKTDE
jgi:hypothetical protein